MNTNPEVAHELVGRLVAAFPTARLGDETRTLWAGQMRHVSEPTARAAVATLIKERRTFPAVADFWVAVDRHREATTERQPAERALEPGLPCEECDGTGFTFTTPPEVTPGDVVRCSRGCMPPRPNQTFAAPPRIAADVDAQYRERGLRHIGTAREILAGVRRPAPMGRETRRKR